MATDPSQGAVSDLLRRIGALEREIQQLKAAPRLNRSSIDGGRLVVRDSAGNDRIYLGELPGSGFGIEVQDVSAVTTFRCDESGIDYPAVYMPWNRPGEYSTTSSTSFQTAYRSGFNRVEHDAFDVVIAIFSLDGATVWEWRPALYKDGSLVATGTARQETGGGSSVSSRYRMLWAPAAASMPMGDTGRWTFQIQQRVVSGAGSVQSSAPEQIALTSTAYTGATSTPAYSAVA